MPKIVTIITPGFGAGPGGFLDSNVFDDIQTQLNNKIVPGSELDCNTFSEVVPWNSTQYFAQGLLTLFADKLGITAAQLLNFLGLVSNEAKQADAAG